MIDLQPLTFLATSGLVTPLRALERARACACELVARPRGMTSRVLTMVNEPEAVIDSVGDMKNLSPPARSVTPT